MTFFPKKKEVLGIGANFANSSVLEGMYIIKRSIKYRYFYFSILICLLVF